MATRVLGVPGTADALPFLKEMLRDWVRHRCISKGAALAFYALFSLAPMLVLVIALSGMVFGAEAAAGEILRQLRGLIGTQGAAAVEALIKGARDPATGAVASMTAGAMLIVGSTTAFAELKDSLDEIWAEQQLPESGILEVLRDRMLSFGLVVALGFMLLVSLAVNAALAAVERYYLSGWAGQSTLAVAISSFVTFLVITALFAVIYKLLPAVRLSWSDVWIGAGITAALFAVGKYFIGLYLGNAALTSSLGAVGSLGVLALWVYYSAQIFFLGAEFTRLYAQQHGSLRRVTTSKIRKTTKKER